MLPLGSAFPSLNRVISYSSLGRGSDRVLIDFLEVVSLAGPTSVGVVGVGISTKECLKEARSFWVSHCEACPVGLAYPFFLSEGDGTDVGGFWVDINRVLLGFWV